MRNGDFSPSFLALTSALSSEEKAIKEDEMLLDRYRKLLETGDLDGLRDLYAADAVIDANVPAWRFQREGRDEIREQYAQWLPKGPSTR